MLVTETNHLSCGGRYPHRSLNERDSCYQAKVVSGCHAVNQYPQLVTPRNRVDERGARREHHFPSQLADARLVVEASIWAPYIFAGSEPP